MWTTVFRHGALLAAAIALVAPPAARGVQEHEALREAARDLKTARRHLRAAPQTYWGHRDEAVREIDRALEAIRLAIAGVGASHEAPTPEEDSE